MTDRPFTVCVYCSSSISIDQRYLDLAADVGTEIGRRGHALVSGGGSVSMMGAVATAARAAGAHTVGVIPSKLLELEVSDIAADELVITDTMRQRKGEMDARADAFLALPGGIGTLEELMEVWTARVLAMHGKPVVVLDPTDLFAALRAQIDTLVGQGFMRPAARDAVWWARDVHEAFGYLEAPAAEVRPVPPSVAETLEGD